MDETRRKSIRLPGYDYTQAGGYFVTAVTFRREHLFGEVLAGKMVLHSLGLIVEACWQEIPVHFPQVTVDAFVVMPNHAHGILFIHEEARKTDGIVGVVGARYISPLPPPLAPTPTEKPHGYPKGSLGGIIANFKAAVTRRAGRELNSGNIWQRGYYEHILRDEADYERAAAYILANPENWEEDEEFM